MKIVFLLIISLPTIALSQCFGTTSNGSIKNAVKLPTSGENFESYSYIAHFLGRTYVHKEVKKILLNTYKQMKRITPNIKYKYAETGKEHGGKFSPHKTHQNGLSVDHMVPVLKQGETSILPTHLFNKWGYNIDFTLDGVYDEYQLDFEAMALLIKQLHIESVKAGFDIEKVIFDPKMTPLLLKTKEGEYLAKNISFTKKRAWVRHDDHFHVDFKIPCEVKAP